MAKKKQPEFITVSVRVPPKVMAELDTLAATTPSASPLYPFTRSDIIRQAIDRHLRAERRREARV